MYINFRCKEISDYLQYDFLGEIYSSGAKRVGRYKFPQLKATKILPSGDIKSFNYMLSSVNLEKSWYHCFCDDYQFERLWNNLYYYMPFVLKAKGFISTDFSLYRDYKDDILIWNCYRNRVMAYAMQKAGGSIIPTAGFGDEETWEWCLCSISSRKKRTKKSGFISGWYSCRSKRHDLYKH